MTETRPTNFMRPLLKGLMVALLTTAYGCGSGETILGTAHITNKGCFFEGRGVSGKGGIADVRTETTENGWRCVLEIDRRRITKNP